MVAVVTTRLVVPPALRLHHETSSDSGRVRDSPSVCPAYGPNVGSRILTDARKHVRNVIAGHEGARFVSWDLRETDRTCDGEQRYGTGGVR
jgi:hypothetical protein